MAYEFPTQMVKRPETLLYDDGFSADYAQAISNVRTAGLFAQVGLSEERRRQVLAAAYGRDIREYCPNDISRFGTVAAGERWAAKGRAMVMIVDQIDRLMAYGWAGPEENKKIPDAPVTTAYRVTAAGKKFAAEMKKSRPTFSMGYLLGSLVIPTAMRFGAAPSELSLETWESNIPANKLYAKLGFVLRAESELEERSTFAEVGTANSTGHVVLPGNEEFAPQRVEDRRLYYQFAPEQ
jgi:hypothetical protein